ncbi:MAG: GGDEF domain-containing protein [Halochromatium sp.]|uniref:GGDEF domain-containing protein n=1 Tax=Halochromatium sp. TaxID=2049430 RepID=UPI00397CD8A8
MNIKHRSQIYNVYVVVGLSSLLLIGSFYLFGMRPLIGYLRAMHTESIDLALQNSVGRVRAIFSNHEDLARQVASRRAIREQQAAFLRGEITREALVDFSQPKLADALDASDAMRAIVRHDPDGDRLFSVGVPVPNRLTDACEPETLERVRMLPNAPAERTDELVYCSPIFDEAQERIGFDLLIISDRAIQRFIDEQSRPAHTLALILGEREIRYWPSQTADEQAHAALRQFLTSGASDPRFVIHQQPLEFDAWSLVSIVDAEQFFAPIDRQTLILLVTILVATLVIYLLTVLALRPIVSTLAREEQLLVLARTDGLTGLYNHAYMQELLDAELERSARYQRPLMLVLFDIDHFKALNDEHGHQAGDQVLLQLANLCQSLTRDSDRLARYGGEEFLVILPESEREQGQRFAERLRHEIEQATFTFAATPLRITVSIGLAHWNGRGDPPTKAELVRAADRALYRSKEQGRNRVSLD